VTIPCTTLHAGPGLKHITYHAALPQLSSPYAVPLDTKEAEEAEVGMGMAAVIVAAAAVTAAGTAAETVVEVVAVMVVVVAAAMVADNIYQIGEY
jgi:hypothetical protein